MTEAHRPALEAIAEGESRSFAPPKGTGAAALRRQLSVAAHRLWGKGSYQTTIEGEAVRLTRRAPDRAPAGAAEETAPSPAAEAGWLDRPAAAAYCRDKGLSHVTGDYLRKLAGSRRGPLHHRMGRYVYYRRADLDAWMAQAMHPVLPSRAA